MNQILLNGISLNDLLQHIGQVIDDKLKQTHKKETPKTSFLSRAQVSQLLKISLPTLNEWSKLGWLQSYKIGNRVLYKQNEVEDALHKVSSFKFKKGGYNAA